TSQVWSFRFIRRESGSPHTTRHTPRPTNQPPCYSGNLHGRLTQRGRPMHDRAILRLSIFRKTGRLWPRLLAGVIGIGMLLAGLPAQASESQAPWECSSYTGDAHTRCVGAYMELQRDQIAALQEKMKAQEETVNRLKAQLDRQASTSSDLQRQLAQRPAVVQAAPPIYTYPSVGFGLYLGSPWIYGPPYYYPPFFYGPRYYGLGYWGHRW